MKIHFIAIGGSAMHSLALALHQAGHEISGSDDELFEPSRSRLIAAGIFPQRLGWQPERITQALQAVVLGMHARADNPELQRAMELNIPIYSYPEFIYQQTAAKRRIVIGGSHGKTTITSMVLHALHKLGREVDYLLGAQIAGYANAVKLSATTDTAVIEGDEYLSSPIDRRPKFHLYRPHVAVITGIAWDHINVFPTEEVYLEQFRGFIKCIEPGGSLLYYAGDPQVQALVSEAREDLRYQPYSSLPYEVRGGKYYVQVRDTEQAVEVFGAHNMQNLSGALEVLCAMGFERLEALRALSSFEGASRRLELVAQRSDFAVYKDFAHAPSKLRATIAALREKFPRRRLVACMELHTFSSLNPEFLPQYAHSMDQADEALVYFNPEVVAHKKLPPLEPSAVRSAFARDVEIHTSSSAFQEALLQRGWQQSVLLLMSSGNFDGLDYRTLGEALMRGGSPRA